MSTDKTITELVEEIDKKAVYFNNMSFRMSASRMDSTHMPDSREVTRESFELHELCKKLKALTNKPEESPFLKSVENTKKVYADDPAALEAIQYLETFYSVEMYKKCTDSETL